MIKKILNFISFFISRFFFPKKKIQEVYEVERMPSFTLSNRQQRLQKLVIRKLQQPSSSVVIINNGIVKRRTTLIVAKLIEQYGH